jgi:hypothetical protein
MKLKFLNNTLTFNQKLLSISIIVIVSIFYFSDFLLKFKYPNLIKDFRDLEVTLIKSRNMLEIKNEYYLKSIYSQLSNNPFNERSNFNKVQAEKCRMSAHKLLFYIRGFKDFIITKAGGWKNIGDGKSHKNREINNPYMSTSYILEQGLGIELKNNINSCRLEMINLLSDIDRENVKSDLIAEDLINGDSWEKEMFNKKPAAVVLVLLTKIENDILNTEIQVLDCLVKN